MKKTKTGMVFGVFDGLHEGHRYFLESASEKCEKFIVVVAQNGASATLKGRMPKYSLEDRIEAIEKLNSAWTVVSGDSVQGEWNALKKYQPDVVFLGHDQSAVADELEKIHIFFSFIEAYRPEQFKSSILHQSEGVSKED
ncbi:MAG: adenylyltransferase/cytidyltransferase family protein [Patescibacteria group bacterium]